MKLRVYNAITVEKHKNVKKNKIKNRSEWFSQIYFRLRLRKRENSIDIHKTYLVCQSLMEKNQYCVQFCYIDRLVK